jgi:hypothetical protein
VAAQAIFAKARKLPKQSPELKADLEAFEAKLDADAAEVAEEEAAAAAAAAAQQGGGEGLADGSEGAAGEAGSSEEGAEAEHVAEGGAAELREAVQGGLCPPDSVLLIAMRS